MISVSGIAIPLDYEADCRGLIAYTQGKLVREAARALGIPEQSIQSVEAMRRSVDARRKSNVHFVVNAAVALQDEHLEDELAANQRVNRFKPYEPLEVCACGKQEYPPVVVGSGPAGLFAALYLARAGACPVLIEQGPSVHDRAQAVQAFNEGGPLNTHANIQFGEGGAGTFSDGKLTTNIKHAMKDHVLHWFAEAGAPQSILWDARPHIGSDRLPAVVEAMRKEIEARGGMVMFNTKLTNIHCAQGKLQAITLQGPEGTQELPVHQMVLALGHSARDTFSMLHRCGISMEQKPFSIGVRIEHLQQAINDAQWGSSAAHEALGAA